MSSGLRRLSRPAHRLHPRKSPGAKARALGGGGMIGPAGGQPFVPTRSPFSVQPEMPAE